MSNKLKNISECIWPIIEVIFSVAGVGIFGYMNYPCGIYQNQDIYFGATKVNVEISDTSCKTVMGLSGRNEIKDNTGMLFVYMGETEHSIWMKNMKFPIDAIWLDSDKEIVLIEKNIQPNSYPKNFGKEVLSKYVVELPAGFVNANKLKVGDWVSI